MLLRDHQRTPPLFFQRRFWPMWTALSFGAFADNVLRQALLIGIPYGVIAMPGFANPDDAIPFIGALLPLAIMLFSSVSGQIADKYETSMLFRRIKAAEIVLMAVAAVSFISGNGILSVFMLFAMGAQSAFFSPVRVGAMPKYLEADELVRGNGLCNLGLFSAILIGYAVGGGLIATESGGVKVAIVLVVAALIGWLGALATLPIGANDPGLRLSVNAVSQTSQMFRHVFASRGVAPPLFGIGAFYFLSTAVTVLTPLFARDTLGGDAFVATILNGLFAVGAGLGAIGASRLAKRRTGLGFATVGVLAAGCLTVGIYLASPLLLAGDGAGMTVRTLFSTPRGLLICSAFVATAALMGLYIAPLQAAAQRRAPAPVRARIMAASGFTNAAFAIPGSLSVLGVTAFRADPATGFLWVGLGMLAIGAIMLVRHRRMPPGLYEEALLRHSAPAGR